MKEKDEEALRKVLETAFTLDRAGIRRKILFVVKFVKALMANNKYSHEDLRKAYNAGCPISWSDAGVIMEDKSFEDWFDKNYKDKKVSKKNEIVNITYPVHPELENLSELQLKFLSDLKNAFSKNDVKFVRGERILIDGEIVPGILCSTVGRMPYEIFLPSTIDLIKDMMKISNRWKKNI